jgi:hypothetical protein
MVGSGSDGLDGVQLIWHADRVGYWWMASDPFAERCVDSRGCRFGHSCCDSVSDDPSHPDGGEVLACEANFQSESVLGAAPMGEDVGRRITRGVWFNRLECQEGWVLWPEAPPGLAAKHLPKQQARQGNKELNPV